MWSANQRVAQLDNYERNKLSIAEIMKSLLIYGIEVYEDRKEHKQERSAWSGSATVYPSWSCSDPIATRCRKCKSCLFVRIAFMSWQATFVYIRRLVWKSWIRGRLKDDPEKLCSKAWALVNDLDMPHAVVIFDQKPFTYSIGQAEVRSSWLQGLPRFCLSLKGVFRVFTTCLHRLDEEAFADFVCLLQAMCDLCEVNLFLIFTFFITCVYRHICTFCSCIISFLIPTWYPNNPWNPFAHVFIARTKLFVLQSFLLTFSKSCLEELVEQEHMSRFEDLKSKLNLSPDEQEISCIQLPVPLKFNFRSHWLCYCKPNHSFSIGLWMFILCAQQSHPLSLVLDFLFFVSQELWKHDLVSWDLRFHECPVASRKLVRIRRN